MKATSYIYCDEPHAHDDMFNLTWGFLHVEGGAEIYGKNLRFMANDIQIDDGGVIQVNDGGHLPADGEGMRDLRHHIPLLSFQTIPMASKVSNLIL